jgi:hypothetical protein
MNNKRMILLLLFILLLTGCVRTDTYSDNYVNLVSNVLNSNNKETNEVGSGYKFYVPKGVRLIDNENNNQVFIALGTKIYMYVDITSYYYKNSLNYSNDDSSFYLENIVYGDKSGFIQINKDDDEYFVKIVYNYAKIEVYTDKYNLNDIVVMSSILVNSIDYNDTIIEKLLDDNNNSGSEITYNIEKPASASSDFSKYLEEYITEDEADTSIEKLPDE